MERGERIGLIKKLAERLEDEHETDAELTLRTFELPADGYDGEYETRYSYLVNKVEHGSDTQLAELHRYLFPDDVDVIEAPDESAGPWAAGTFRLFVSHTAAYRESAGRLSTTLRPWGVHAFVAHDAIEPTREWEEVIEIALRTCQGMCVLVTPDMVESRWCDQEVGFALARRVLIVPVRMGVDPHGFIGKYQAIPLPEKTTPYNVAHAVFDALARNPLAASDMAPVIVRRYANSDGYDNTRDVFPLLETISAGTWTPQMIEEVKRAAEVNSQVRDALLPGGREVPAAVDDLLAPVAEPVAPAPAPAGDDDIPF